MGIGLRGDIRAAHDQAYAPARQPLPERPEQRGGRGRARRLDREPGMGSQEPHGRDHLGVLDAHDLIEVARHSA